MADFTTAHDIGDAVEVNGLAGTVVAITIGSDRKESYCVEFSRTLDNGTVKSTSSTFPAGLVRKPEPPAEVTEA